MPKRKGSSSGNESATAEQKMKKQKTEKAKLKPKKTEDKKEKGVPSKIDFSSSQAAFESLISPTKCEEFFDRYWEKQPLVLNRGEISYYGDLFTKENLFSILKQNKILYEDDINVCRFVEGEKEMLNGTGQAKEEKIKKDFKSLKATVQFHQPQRFKDEIWQLNAALEKEFGCLLGANVYITPAGAQGLAPHYDDIEAFVLQLEGKKQWSLYKPPIELPQDYSADLTEDVIGEPTHKILLEPGDLLYFPRGTVHQAQTPEDQDHSTHITLSTYQNNNWGNLINHGLTQALERAMEEDVEFRRGLPMKYLDFMGYTKSVDADESTSEQNGKAKTEPSVDADVVEKQEKFTATLTKLLTRLADYIDPHSAADEMAIDFMSSRLPPFLPSDDKSEDKCEKTGQPPEDNSEVKLLYPGYVRMCVSSGPDRSDDEDDDEEDDEEDEDDAISEEEEDIEESSEEEESKKRSKNAKRKAGKKSKADKKEQNKKPKQEKGKKSKEQENSTEGSEDDESMDEDEEDDEEDEYQGEDDLGEDWIVLYHSVSNDRSNHMIGVPKPYALKFPLSHKDALLQIINRSSEYLLVSGLPLPKADRLKMVTSLWAEGLLEVKQEAS